MSTYLDGVKYAEDVKAGKIVACKQVRQACSRFLGDQKRKDFRFSFNIERANHVLNFIETFIKHVQGKQFAGQTVDLEPWQVFVLINMYGWRDEYDNRRFQNVVLEVARKNGKSLFASALAVYEAMFGDDGGEIFSLATKRDQAKKAWDVARAMIEKSDSRVRDQFTCAQHAIVCKTKGTKYVTLGRDSKSEDGHNPSMNIFDEAAAYGDRNLVEVMTSATGARSDFLNLYITTAQFSKITIYYEHRSYIEGILEGRYEDDRWFGMIYTLDEGDDWRDPEVWIKSNPNLDVSITRDYLEGQVKHASEVQSATNNVLVKHFNVWVSSADAWINTESWDLPSNIVPEVNKSGELYVGLDLAQTRDLCAVTSLYVNGDCYHADFKCFLPEETVRNAPSHVLPLYREAIKRGVLVPTEGPITDYNEIQGYIEHLAKTHKLEAIAYDPYNATQLVTNLLDQNINMLEVRQGMSYLSPAAKETERLILGGQIKHTADPFITWQLENCVQYTDVNDNIKIRKGDDESRKIDSIIALIMAVSLAAGKLKSKKFTFDVINL